MLQPLPGASRAVSFIGAGLAMVAHGASAAVGLDDRGDEREAESRHSADNAEGPRSDIGHSVGTRLEAYAYKGC